LDNPTYTLYKSQLLRP